MSGKTINHKESEDMDFSKTGGGSSLTARDRRLYTTGLITFGLSGVCAISSGIVVSLLREKYGFDYSVTGTLLALFSIGNLIANFASGILPKKIGARATVAIFCLGYGLGYLLMGLTGAVIVLGTAFVMVGLCKGCAINNCTVLVGNHCTDRSKSMSLLHACFALGALLCPFLISALASISTSAALFGLSFTGFLMWLLFWIARLPGKEESQEEEERAGGMEFLKDWKFWVITGILFCQNAAEQGVNGWLVTYYKDQGILSGGLSAYTVSIMWGATLIGRLLIAFVIPIRDTFKALAIMGLGCTVLFAGMIFAGHPILAIVMLFAFASSMAGINPIGVASVGKVMSNASVGVMLPVAALSQILMPWIIGQIAQNVNIHAGMASNLVPCAGIFVLSMIMKKKNVSV